MSNPNKGNADSKRGGRGGKTSSQSRSHAVEPEFQPFGMSQVPDDVRDKLFSSYRDQDIANVISSDMRSDRRIEKDEFDKLSQSSGSAAPPKKEAKEKEKDRKTTSDQSSVPKGGLPGGSDADKLKELQAQWKKKEADFMKQMKKMEDHVEQANVLVNKSKSENAQLVGEIQGLKESIIKGQAHFAAAKARSASAGPSSDRNQQSSQQFEAITKMIGKIAAQQTASDARVAKMEETMKILKDNIVRHTEEAEKSRLATEKLEERFEASVVMVQEISNKISNFKGFENVNSSIIAEIIMKTLPSIIENKTKEITFSAPPSSMQQEIARTVPLATRGGIATAGSSQLPPRNEWDIMAEEAINGRLSIPSYNHLKFLYEELPGFPSYKKVCSDVSKAKNQLAEDVTDSRGFAVILVMQDFYKSCMANTHSASILYNFFNLSVIPYVKGNILKWANIVAGRLAAYIASTSDDVSFKESSQ